ncbi:hypothetical protein [Serratia liquefaciens]|uniref:hypothetical protein n=1 Tax=Serratia liquefaciens TaxID=614 RepID=UPI0022BA0D24|nr:hypothetical protein [Serratia liquefaciens]
MNKHTVPSIWSFDGDEAAGRNTVVCGTSGSGKTTLMVSLVALLDKSKKVQPDEDIDDEGRNNP